MTTAVKGPFFDVPAGTPATQCRSCGAVAYWIKTAAGKPMLVDCDVPGGCEPWKGVPGDGEHDGRGVSHFSQCPDADQWRKAR